MQQRLNNNIQSKPALTKPYSRGPYNKYDEKEQYIRISEGCPNMCEYCRESFECGTKPIYFDIPEIVRNNVKIMDMNLIYKPDCIKILDDLGSRKVGGKIVHYELICGIDFRYMTQEKADALKRNRFINIRLAFDYSIKEHQYKVKDCINMLVKAGYKPKDLMVFMVCNWKISFNECMRKLDLCKVWNVKVADCYFDNQLMPNVKPIYWSHRQIKEFRSKCRKHNQIVIFGIDTECK